MSRALVTYRGVQGVQHTDDDGQYITADLPNGVIISGPGEADWVLSEFKGMVDDYLDDFPGYEKENNNDQENP